MSKRKRTDNTNHILTNDYYRVFPNCNGIAHNDLELIPLPGFGWLYAFFDIRTGKFVYGGQSMDSVYNRLKHHKNDNSCRAMHDAISKLGLKSFNFIIIKWNVPEALLDPGEIDLIALHDTFHNGYNLNQGGGRHAPRSGPSRSDSK
jgi:hypothetical protein